MADLGSIGRASPRPLASVLNVAAAQGLPNAGRSLFPPFSYVSIPDAEKKSIRGFVKNENGDGISRLVMAIKRSTGALQATTVSSALDGSFELLTPDTSECVVLLVPDNADGRNAVALDRIVPVNQL
jgi:hypothetical protein